MFTRPADLADDVVSAVVQNAWELTIRRIDYAPGWVRQLPLARVGG